MIPKIIHYCWFGQQNQPELVQKCIQSWKNYLSDYELMLWNEDSFDVMSVPYTAQAYKEKKQAFVADYVRVWALKNYGGIYMDSDVEVLKPLNDLLHNVAFVGFEHHASENNPLLEAALIGSEQNGKWIENVFSYFDNRDFLDSSGKMDITPIPFSMAVKTKELYDIKFNNTEQHFDDLTVYPWEYFSPKSNHDYKIRCSANTYAIHHFKGSWIPKYSKIVASYIQKYGNKGKVLCSFLHPIATIRHLHYKKITRSRLD